MHNLTVPVLAVASSSEFFPVRRIYCVGQNYAEHAREMGSDPRRSAPFFFSKPADAVVPSGTRLPFPVHTHELHHEVELVVALQAGGSDIPAAQAGALIFGYAVGIDLTRRDLQNAAKKSGRPWDMAKGFDASAPIGALTRGTPPACAAIRLMVDGELRQSADLKDMIWSVPEIISTLSSYVRLAAGDLIFTGTPSGVGAIRPGQALRADIVGVETLEVSFDP